MESSAPEMESVVDVTLLYTPPLDRLFHVLPSVLTCHLMEGAGTPPVCVTENDAGDPSHLF